MSWDAIDVPHRVVDVLRDAGREVGAVAPDRGGIAHEWCASVVVGADGRNALPRSPSRSESARAAA